LQQEGAIETSSSILSMSFVYMCNIVVYTGYVPGLLKRTFVSKVLYTWLSQRFK